MIIHRPGAMNGNKIITNRTDQNILLLPSCDIHHSVFPSEIKRFSFFNIYTQTAGSFSSNFYQYFAATRLNFRSTFLTVPNSPRRPVVSSPPHFPLGATGHPSHDFPHPPQGLGLVMFLIALYALYPTKRVAASIRI